MNRWVEFKKIRIKFLMELKEINPCLWNTKMACLLREKMEL